MFDEFVFLKNHNVLNVFISSFRMNNCYNDKNIKNMISKILILSKYNNCLGQMAQGWLEFFDKDLTVISGAVDEKRDLMKEAVDVMKEVSIDLTDQKDEIPEEYLSDNWNYVIIDQKGVVLGKSVW